jgi:hypothetical protein
MPQSLLLPSNTASDTGERSVASISKRALGFGVRYRTRSARFVSIWPGNLDAPERRGKAPGLHHDRKTCFDMRNKDGSAEFETGLPAPQRLRPFCRRFEGLATALLERLGKR